MTTTIPSTELRHWANVTLGWAGVTQWEPSSWERHLIEFFAKSDLRNQIKLGMLWPEALECWTIYATTDNWQDELILITMGEPRRG